MPSRSIVWNYFDNDVEKKLVTCKTCKQSVTGNTSNLRRHLRYKHQDQHAELVELEASKRGDEAARGTVRKRKLNEQPSATFSKAKLYEKDSKKHEKVNNFLVQTVCKGTLPSRSIVWKYFDTDVDKEVVTCKTCKKLVKRDSGNTSNLRRHLQYKHQDQHAELVKLEASKCGDDVAREMVRKRKLNEEPIIMASVSKVKLYEEDSNKQQKLNTLLVQMICKDALPFRLLKSDSFKAFISELDPRYQLPTRKSLSQDLIPGLYDATKQSVVKLISQADTIALTTDAWTVVSNEAFISVTAHYLLDDFTYESRCLTVQHTPGRHTAESIRKHLDEVCEQWGITQRSSLLPLYVVTDSDANVKKAVSLMQHTKWLPCFAHSLQLVVQKVLAMEELSEVKDLLTSARSIVGHFHENTVATKMLEEFQGQFGLETDELIQDCSTRWISQVLMLQRLIEQKDAVSMVLCCASDVENLDDDQWKAATFLVDALHPFLDVTTILSETRYPTLSMVLPLLDGITEVLKEEETAESIPCLRTALIRELDEQFSYIRSNETYYVATVVDPRYKLIPFTDDAGILHARSSVIKAMERASVRQMQGPSSASAIMTQSQSATSTPAGSVEQSKIELNLSCQTTETPKKSSIWEKFDKLVSSQHEASARTCTAGPASELYMHEFELYLLEGVIERSSCPFRWWCQNCVRFPLLATVAREHLTIPGTSVPSERLYSKAGDVVNKKRCAIKPSRAEQMIFLMENT